MNIDPQRRTQLFISLLVDRELNETDPTDCWEDKVNSASWEMRPWPADKWHMLFLKNRKKQKENLNKF